MLGGCAITGIKATMVGCVTSVDGDEVLEECIMNSCDCDIYLVGLTKQRFELML